MQGSPSLCRLGTRAFPVAGGRHRVAVLRPLRQREHAAAPHYGPCPGGAAARALAAAAATAAAAGAAAAAAADVAAAAAPSAAASAASAAAAPPPLPPAVFEPHVDPSVVYGQLAVLALTLGAAAYWCARHADAGQAPLPLARGHAERTHAARQQRPL
jgi:hypothetical protein